MVLAIYGWKGDKRIDLMELLNNIKNERMRFLSFVGYRKKMNFLLADHHLDDENALGK